jgi:hypothetical protein
MFCNSLKKTWNKICRLLKTPAAKLSKARKEIKTNKLN